MTSSETYPKKKLLDKIDSSWKCILALIDHSVAFVLWNLCVSGMGMELAAKSLGLGRQQKRRENGPGDTEGGHFQWKTIGSRTCLHDHLSHFKIKV